MGTNHNPDNQGHMSRREAMQRGVCGAAGMVAAGGLSSRASAAPFKIEPEELAKQKATRDAAAKAKAKKGQAKSIIQIFLWGGISQNDCWDPKPGTGYDTWVSLINSSPPTCPESKSARCSPNWPSRPTSIP